MAAFELQCFLWIQDSTIEDEEVIKKILKHLGLWKIKARQPTQAKGQESNIHIDYTVSQVPPSEDYHYKDPDYSIEDYTSWSS